MTDKTLTQATALAGASVANDDEIWIWDVSAGQLKKTTRAELIGGAYVLIVPASGTVDLLGVAQTFTAEKTFAPAGTTTKPVIINVPASNSVAATEWQYAGSARAGMYQFAATSQMQLLATDTGADGIGCRFYAGRNTNASTPAAGVLAIEDKAGDLYRIWPDDSGVLRILTGAWPTNANDTGGTVVGAQTSNLDAKTVLGDPIGIDDVLAAIQLGAAAVRRFVYKNGEFNGEEFSGLVTDFAPRYGMDRDAAHPAGKSLNIVTALGDLMRAVANLTERVRALEGAS